MPTLPVGTTVPSFTPTPDQTAQAIGVGSALLEDEEKRKRRLRGLPAMKKGGTVKSASSRADGCAVRGKTRGTLV